MAENTETDLVLTCSDESEESGECWLKVSTAGPFPEDDPAVQYVTIEQKETSIFLLPEDVDQVVLALLRLRPPPPQAVP